MDYMRWVYLALWETYQGPPSRHDVDPRDGQ